MAVVASDPSAVVAVVLVVASGDHWEERQLVEVHQVVPGKEDTGQEQVVLDREGIDRVPVVPDREDIAQELADLDREGIAQDQVVLDILDIDRVVDDPGKEDTGLELADLGTADIGQALAVPDKEGIDQEQVVLDRVGIDLEDRAPVGPGKGDTVLEDPVVDLDFLVAVDLKYLIYKINVNKITAGRLNSQTK